MTTTMMIRVRVQRENQTWIPTVVRSFPPISLKQFLWLCFYYTAKSTETEYFNPYELLTSDSENTDCETLIKNIEGIINSENGPTNAKFPTRYYLIEWFKLPANHNSIWLNFKVYSFWYYSIGSRLYNIFYHGWNNVSI